MVHDDSGEIPTGLKEANHMKGMEGAKGTIDAAEDTTVYMIDYMPTNDGEEVKNHKWVTESELSKE